MVGDLRCSAWQVAQGGQSDVAFLGVELDAPLEEFLEILLVAGNALHRHLAAFEKGIECRAVAVFQATAEGQAA